MGRRGPPRKPTAIKVAQGQRKRDLPKGEVTPPVEKEPKNRFELSERGLEIFKDVSTRLGAVNLVTTLDVSTLTRYAELFDKWIYYRDLVAKAPMIKDKDGEIKPNPALDSYLKIHDKLLRIEIQYGMTPSARASMATSPHEERSKKKSVTDMLYGDEES